MVAGLISEQIALLHRIGGLVIIAMLRIAVITLISPFPFPIQIVTAA